MSLKWVKQLSSSADSVWEPDSDDAASTADENPPPSDGDLSDDDDFGEDGIISISKDLWAKIIRLMMEDPCEDRCLKGEAARLEQFLCSLSQMASRKRKQSIMTTLLVFQKTDTALRHRGHGLRQQFNHYLPLVGRKYQIFSMQDKLPGVVTCCKGLHSPPIMQDFRRSYDGIVMDGTRARVLFQTDLEPLPNPLPNSEKIEQLYNNMQLYVPGEYVNYPMYDPPNDEERKAKEIKHTKNDRA
ncbi:hypothetical protein BBJ28_00026876 [Nothophytophthora sp. Chile5]|nr:hypothetical protein BBJ28_00026876 [Nothophytophthora sp. Chile5]